MNDKPDLALYSDEQKQQLISILKFILQSGYPADFSQVSVIPLRS